jgi:hypothetical protein
MEGNEVRKKKNGGKSRRAKDFDTIEPMP